MAQTRRKGKATRKDAANNCAEVFALPSLGLAGTLGLAKRLTFAAVAATAYDRRRYPFLITENRLV